MSNTSFLACLWVAALLLCGPAYAQVYKCTGPTGATAFQDAPCPGKGRAVDVPAPNVVEGNPVGEMMVRAQAARGARVEQATARGEVLVGMTEAEMRAVMGNASAVNTTVTGGEVSRQYVYRNGGNTQYLYTRDGVVTGGQYSERVRRR